MKKTLEESKTTVQQHYHEKGSVRHLEKRRNGTCTFANRIAQVSLDCYHKRVPTLQQQQQILPTCVSTIVAHDSNTDNLTVLSLGVGTKFCQSNTTTINENTEKYGTRIRDGHAEVLAKRSFQKYLITELTTHSKNNNNDNNKSNHRNENDSFILESITEENEPSHERQYFRLKSNITLHMYCSSAPCGNATWKKFANLHNSKEIFQTDLPQNSWPGHQLPHQPLQAHSTHLGQFALLMKKTKNTTTTTTTTNEISPLLSPYLHPKQREWPCFQISTSEDNDWCPPGTSVWKGSSHTCSDKICRWNILGLQGSLLSSCFKKPIYLTTITIGRKYNFEMCRRALCCRATPPIKKRRNNHNNKKNVSSTTSLYQLHHPVLMETNVYMNSNNVIDMSCIQSIGQDVKFNSQESSYCYAWWRSYSPTITTTTTAERIDGLSGYRVTNNSNHNDDENDDENKQQPELISEVATISLQQQVCSLLFPTMKTYKICNSLEEYASWKEQISPEYEQFKEHLLTKHPVFCQWKRRRYHFLHTNK